MNQDNCKHEWLADPRKAGTTYCRICMKWSGDKMKVYPDRKGMKVSMSGLLTRVAGSINQTVAYPDYSYSITELLKHLQQTGEAFYSGNLEVVDEFFQLYCLDEGRDSGE